MLIIFDSVWRHDEKIFPAFSVWGNASAEFWMHNCTIAPMHIYARKGQDTWWLNVLEPLCHRRRIKKVEKAKVVASV